MIKIGKKITQLREERNLSMRELAEKLNVSHAHISKLEADKHSPSLKFLEELAEFFDVHVRYFFDDIVEVTEIDSEFEMAFDKTVKDGSKEESKRKLLALAKRLQNENITFDKITETISEIRNIKL